MTPPTRASGSWRAFLQAHARLTRRLDDELRAAHGLSLAEYDALVQLAQAPGRRLRMSVLADRVLLSRSGITRLVDRLVADGMVERVDLRDRRARRRGVADPGRPRPAARAPRPRTSTASRRYFLDAIDADDQRALERGLGA